MFDFWQRLSGIEKALIIVLIIVVIIAIIIIIIKFKKPKTKEGYTTMLNSSKLGSNSDVSKSGIDPLTSYVNGWINSVKTLYNTKVASSEKFVQPRTMKDFTNYNYLPMNTIMTGKIRY